MKKFLSVLLAVMMVLSTVSFAAPSVAGTYETAVEVPAVEETAVEEAAADLAADVIVANGLDQRGVVVYDIDFDDMADGTSIADDAKVSTIGTVNPDFEGYENWYFNWGNGYTSATVEGGKAKFALKEGYGKWPQIHVDAPSGTVILSDGIFSTYAEHMIEYADTQTATATFGNNAYARKWNGTKWEGTTSNQASTKTGKTAVDGEWQYLGGSYTLEGKEYNGIECIIYIPTYTANNTGSDTYWLDNLELYWKPVNANVTVKYGDTTVVKSVSTESAVSLAELANSVDVGILNYVTGVKIGNETYTTGDSVMFVADTEIEIVTAQIDEQYYDTEKGVLLFDVNFEDYTAGTSLNGTNVMLTDASKTPFSDKLMSHDLKKWYVYLANGSVMADPKDANNLVAGALNITSTGYPQFRIHAGSDDNTNKKYGFVEEPEGTYYLEYDFMDANGALSTTERFGGRSSVIEGDNKQWTELEDTVAECTEPAKVAGEWRHYTATYTAANLKRMGAVSESSFIKIHAAAPNANSYYHDNVKLWWKPATADLTISANGMKDVKITTTFFEDHATTIKVSELLTKAGVDYSEVDTLEYLFRGVSLSPEGGKVYGLDDTLGFFGDSTVYLIFEKIDMSEWTDENGILLFDIDFDDARAASVFTPYVNNKDYLLNTFAKVNPYIVGNEKWALSTSGMDMVGVENGALKFQWDGTGKWPQILIGNPANEAGAELIGKNGTYYFVGDYKVLNAIDADLASIAVTANGFKDGVHQGPSGILALGNGLYTKNSQVLLNEWMTIKGSKSTWNNDTDGIDNDDINKITTVFTYNATSATAGGYYLMDNIKLYWKPDYVDVTIEGGSYEDFETVTFENVSAKATVQEILDMLPYSAKVNDYGQLTNLAKDYVKLGKSASIDAIGNVTLMPVWTPWNKIEGVGQEFATDGAYFADRKGMFACNGFGSTETVGDGSIVTKTYMTMYSGKGEGAYGIYTLGGNLVYKQLTPTAGDSQVHGSNTFTDSYTVAAVPEGAKHRVTINTNLPANNNATYAVVKYKFQNVPDLTSDFANNLGAVATEDGKSATYTDRNGNSATYSNLVEYTGKYYIQTQSGSYQYGGGIEFEAGVYTGQSSADGVTVDLSEIEDMWIYDLVPMNDNINTNGSKAVLIDRPNHFRDMITVWDYVMYVGEGVEEDIEAPLPPEPEKPEYAPESSTETSYRTQAPNGLRFKASMSAEIDAVATDYGWIVGRAVKGATEETLVIGAANTITAYGRQDGVKIKNFFEETDELKTFTAVVYNIPAGNEDDVLCIKPFVKVDGEVYYGAMISKSPRQVAEAHGIDVDELMKK